MLVEGTSCDTEFIAFSTLVADEAGEIMRHYFGTSSVRPRVKSDGSLVTDVDLEVERLTRAMVKQRYPNHGVIGEEYAPEREWAEYTWCIDPLDNTSQFVKGMPNFGFLLALLWRDYIILGMMDLPVLGTRLIGADGHGTLLNGRQVSTRACAELCDATMCLEQPLGKPSRRDDALKQLGSKCKTIRTGCDCVSYGLVAAGEIDAAVSCDLDVYDFAPLDPILRNAGGVLTDWSGRQVGRFTKGAVLGLGDSRCLKATAEILCRVHGR